jgi:hypothetical protein
MKTKTNHTLKPVTKINTLNSSDALFTAKISSISMTGEVIIIFSKEILVTI